MSTSESPPSRRARLVAWFEERLNLSEIFGFITTFGLAYGDIDTRRSLKETIEDAFHRPHPVYVRWPHILGILAFVLFLFQGVTGLFLSFYYQPSPDAAYQSFLVITRDTQFGWYIHQMHSWGSHVLIALLLLRLSRFFFHRAYRSPRELVWIFAILIFLLSVYQSLTGLVLAWDQHSYWSFIRSAEIISHLPVFGSLFGFFVGGYDLGQFALPRFYVLHILAIPGMMLTLFYLHFATIRRIGLSRLHGETATVRPLYPDHIINLLTVLVLLFGVVLTIAVIMPSMTYGVADPHAPFKGVLPPWFMLPAYGLLELLPDALAGSLMMVLLGLVIVVPFFDRADSSASRHLIVRVVFAIAALAVIWLGVLGYRMGG